VVVDHRRADEQLGSALVVRGSLTHRANDLQLKLRGLSRLEWRFLAVSRWHTAHPWLLGATNHGRDGAIHHERKRLAFMDPEATSG